jgi:hypothetical protein
VIVSDLIAYAQRVSGLLGVGQVALPQDNADAQTALMLMLQQWRQKRWLVFRLDNVIFPLIPGKGDYTIGPPPSASGTPPDVVTSTNGYRPANIQSCFLRQEVGGGPNSFPIDFPMRILESRQQYDQISLKSLNSWPASIYYDPILINGTIKVWPIPMQPLFSLYVGFQQAIDIAGEAGGTVELENYLPVESQQAVIYNLAATLCINYALPVNPALAAAARSSLNVMRMTNFALQPLQMPSALRGSTRLRNPMAGFVPEVAAGIPFGVLS